MFHQVELAINSKTSKVMPGVLVRLYDSGGAIVDLFADESGTPIEATSGVPNAALADGDGMYDFWVEGGVYDVRFAYGDAEISNLRKIAFGANASIEIADQPTAIAGLDNEKPMSALRTAQAMANAKSFGASDTAFAPAQYPGILGSLDGKMRINIKRTGGYGSYGVIRSQVLVSAPSNGAGEFDVGVTAWASHQNLTNNNQIFGMWAGANTPASHLSETYVSGAATGLEVNSGNRWADFGLLSDVGGTRYTVGIQVVPDVVPAEGASVGPVYPGSFGVVLGASVHGHKWWTGYLTRGDAIMPGGVTHRDVGGTSVPNAPAKWVELGGYYGRGIDFAGAVFSGAPINLNFSQAHSATATPGSTPSPGNYQGFLKMVSLSGGPMIKIPYFLD